MSTNIISSLGAGSGIDTKTLVSELVAIERQPVEQRLDKQQTRIEAQISGFGALKSGLSDFQALLRPLADPSTFNARSVSFTESASVTPTKLDPNAAVGNYQVEVEQLARSQSLATGVFSDSRAIVGTGTLNISFGSWDAGVFSQNSQRESVQIEITQSNNTLEGIRNAINASNSGAQASIVRDGNDFRLMITSPTGEQNALRIEVNADPGSALESFSFDGSPGGLTQNQAATDSIVKINGLAIRRDTNDIKDVISGLEFTVNRPTAPGEVINFAITEDKATGEQAIRDFVEGFNDFFKFANTLTGYTRNENNELVRGDLATDSIAKSIVTTMRNLLVSAVPGVSGNFISLANLGIRTELDGTLSINERDFKAAINNNFEQVAAIFSQSLTSSSSQIVATPGTAIANAQSGRYEINITQQPTKGSYTGNEIDVLWQDPANFPLSIAEGDISFRVRVNGIESGQINLGAKDYSNMNELLSDLQNAINSDSKMRAANYGVDVSFDEATNQIALTSREFGSSSNVVVTATTSRLSDELGLVVRSGNAGRDVAGTINGVAGFGAGNILLPALNTPASGLNFTIQPGATSAVVDYSKGLSGELNRLIAQFLQKDGAISMREDNLNAERANIDVERERLDARMDLRLQQLQAQFLAMERIISSLQATGDQLDGILDRLPFTAKK